MMGWYVRGVVSRQNRTLLWSQLVNRVPVSSSNLASVGYDAASRTLEVEFLHGAVYQYFNVPAYEHEGLMRAPSHGKYFHAHIRGVYRYTKL